MKRSPEPASFSGSGTVCDSPGILTNPRSDWRPAARALSTRGFAVVPHAMPDSGWLKLHAEATRLRSIDAFSVARVGHGDRIRQEGATRGGSVCWIGAGMPAGKIFLHWMDDLRVALNRSLFLGLDGFDAHYAHYPVGASYGTHIDRHRESQSRIVSAVMYLNADWPADAGGQLVIYDGHAARQLSLSPEGGTLVLFMSDDTPHEALKSTRERWSIAGWFHARA